MNLGRTVFSQLIAFLPDREFRRCVTRYHGDRRLRGFSCWDQFLSMAFAQFTYREGLRDIEACLARLLYAHDPFGAELQMSAYALDSTTIDLCLAMFPWARFRERKGAVKLHTLIDLHGNIPLFVCVTDGKVHDVNILDQIVPQAGAFYVMDRGYLDFERLYRLTLAASFFVTRTKDNVLLQRRYSHPVDGSSGVKSDHTVLLTTPGSAQHYPAALRRVRYFDAEHKRFLVFLTNNFELPALTIANLYKSRWQVELFFKWIKQHLRIKAFFGTSPNAVRTQIWIAISIYVLVAIVKKELHVSASLYQILQVVSVTIFERVPILQAFQHQQTGEKSVPFSNQLSLLDL